MVTNDVFWKHQVAIAKRTMEMSEIGARIMGGMTHQEASEILRMEAERKRAMKGSRKSKR
jgi:hypothetical protein